MTSQRYDVSKPWPSFLNCIDGRSSDDQPSMTKSARYRACFTHTQQARDTRWGIIRRSRAPSFARTQTATSHRRTPSSPSSGRWGSRESAATTCTRATRRPTLRRGPSSTVQSRGGRWWRGHGSAASGVCWTTAGACAVTCFRRDSRRRKARPSSRCTRSTASAPRTRPRRHPCRHFRSTSAPTPMALRRRRRSPRGASARFPVALSRVTSAVNRCSCRRTAQRWWRHCPCWRCRRKVRWRPSMAHSACASSRRRWRTRLARAAPTSCRTRSCRDREERERRNALSSSTCPLGRTRETAARPPTRPPTATRRPTGAAGTRSPCAPRWRRARPASCSSYATRASWRPAPTNWRTDANRSLAPSSASCATWVWCRARPGTRPPRAPRPRRPHEHRPDWLPSNRQRNSFLFPGSDYVNRLNLAQ